MNKPSNKFGIELPPPGAEEITSSAPFIPTANSMASPEELQGTIPHRPKAARKVKDFSAFSPQQLNAHAREIREHFCESKCKALGLKHYTVNSRHDTSDIWRGAAASCLQLKLSPELFVQAIFARYTDIHLLFPNMLSGEKAYLIAKSFVESHGFNKVQSESDLKKACMEDALWHVAELQANLFRRLGDDNFTRTNIFELLRTGSIRCNPLARIYLTMPEYDHLVLEYFGFAAQRVLIFNTVLREGFKALGMPVDWFIAAKFTKPDWYTDEMLN